MSSMSGEDRRYPTPSYSPSFLFFLGFFTLGIGRIFKVESLSVTKVVGVVIRLEAPCEFLAVEAAQTKLSVVSPAYSSFRSRTRHKLRPETMSSP